MPHSARDTLDGQMIGSYRVLTSLGAGGMGVVYKAIDVKLNRTVALKFLAREPEQPVQMKDRLLQEARSASALDHPNIGIIHGIEQTDDGQLFIVMAYYEGETLAQRIGHGPLPPEQAIDIATQIARGLTAAHSHHIIHRDIKPSNVILSEGGIAKIVDFGLARTLTSASSTLTAAVTGTAAYMAPEQATGEPADQRVDVWALGVVFWEMLTGTLPFHGENLPALLFAVVNKPPAPLPDHVPFSLRPVLYRALAKNPAERYQSAEEMLADLERFKAPSHVSKTIDLPGSGLRKLIYSASGTSHQAPSRIGWWIAGLAMVALAALLFFVWPQLNPAHPQHIAVLPFENVGNDPEFQTISDGFLENLTNRLSNLESSKVSLWVVPAGEVRRRKVTDPSTAHREFGANLVVTGSVHRDSGGVHLSLHLIDPANLRQLGGETLDDRTGNLAELQNRALGTLAKWMKVSPPPVTQGGETTRPAAYESYLKALGYLQRYDKPGNLDQAISQLEDATRSDPKFAVAFAAEGEAYLLKYRAEQNPRWLEQAVAVGKRAAELNDQLAPVHITLGRIQTDTGKLDLAAQEFQRALQLDPRSADAIFGLAQIYEKQGRVKEATEMFQKAAALRPDYWDGYNKLGVFYIRQKRYGDAAAQFQRVIELTPDNSLGYINLGVALQLQNKYDEAAKALEKSIQLSPSYAAYSNLGNIYYRQKKPAQAAPLFEKSLALNDKDFRSWTNYGMANRWLALQGDKAAAEKAKSGYQHALTLLEAKAAQDPNDSEVQGRLAHMYAYFGRRADALRHLEASHALGTVPEDFELEKAEVFELLGDRKQAIQALESSIRKGMSRDIISRNPEVQGVLSDPNFKYPH